MTMPSMADIDERAKKVLWMYDYLSIDIEEEEDELVDRVQFVSEIE